MNSEPKQQLRVRDRISALPDELLLCILSFLETKYAVRTCVLSTRWKNIWAYLPTLDFDQTSFIGAKKFWEFINHVLSSRYSSHLNKFRLCLRGYGQSRFDALINTVIGLSVVELDLCAQYPYQFGNFDLPQSLVMCKTLETLKLDSIFMTSVPASGCFPSLKSLHVTFHANVNVLILEALSSFPVLEDLTMDGFLLYNSSLHLNIAAPVLKRLRICFDNYGRKAAGNSYFNNCPKLENLDLVEDASSTYDLAQAKSLVKARIHLPHPYSTEQPSFQTALLAGASNVTDLSFSSHCFEVGPLPAYENLRQLKMVVKDCFCWQLLTKLLERSPILESLVLEREVEDRPQEDSDHDKGSEDEEDSDHEKGSEGEEDSQSEQSCEYEEESGSDNEQRSDDEEGSQHQWDPPDCVPTCCLSHLKNVSIEATTGNGNELEVAKYVLKYGQVLNKMTISMNRLGANEKNKIGKEMLTVPRGSRTCIVEFIKDAC